jgi:hypothetical protein
MRDATQQYQPAAAKPIFAFSLQCPTRPRPKGNLNATGIGQTRWHRMKDDPRRCEECIGVLDIRTPLYQVKFCKKCRNWANMEMAMEMARNGK